MSNTAHWPVFHLWTTKLILFVEKGMLILCNNYGNTLNYKYTYADRTHLQIGLFTGIVPVTKLQRFSDPINLGIFGI